MQTIKKLNKEKLLNAKAAIIDIDYKLKKEISENDRQQLISYKDDVLSLIQKLQTK
jgi:hypothetical protein